MRVLLVTVSLTVAIAVGAVPGWAFFTSRGAGAATAVAASVPRPTGVVASQTAEGTVRVSWNAVTTSLPISYEVRRSNGTTSAVVCSSSTGAPCIDSPVAAGTYTYTVATRSRSWSTTSVPSNAVTVVDNIPSVTSFVRTTPASTNAADVSWTVTFSEPVTGPTLTNFALTSTGITGAAITAVSGSGQTWTVTASTGSGSGTLTARLSSAAGIRDATGNAPVAPVTGETYSIRPFFPSTLTLANGGSNNRIDTGDTITLTFSSPFDHASLCAAWSSAGDHSSTAAVATVVDGGAGNDSMTFALAACPTLRLGTLALGSTGYVSGGSATFGATLTATASGIAITLGTKAGAGTIGSVGSAPTATFTPDSALRATSGVAPVGTVNSTGRF